MLNKKKRHKEYKSLNEKILISDGMGLSVDRVIELFGYSVVKHYIDKVPENIKNEQGYIYISDFMKLYRLDQCLRSIIYPLCSEFESLFKSCLTYVLCQDENNNFKHQSNPHINMNIYNENYKKEYNGKNIYRYNIGRINKEFESKINEYKKNYYPDTAPIWEILDNATLGSVVNFYKSLSFNLQKIISSKFNVECPDVFCTWLNNIVQLRNKISHNGRIFDLKFQNKNPIYYIKEKEIQTQENKNEIINNIIKQSNRTNPEKVPESEPDTLKSILEILEYMTENRSKKILGLSVSENFPIKKIKKLVQAGEKISGF